MWIPSCVRWLPAGCVCLWITFPTTCKTWVTVHLVFFEVICITLTSFINKTDMYLWLLGFLCSWFRSLQVGVCRLPAAVLANRTISWTPGETSGVQRIKCRTKGEFEKDEPLRQSADPTCALCLFYCGQCEKEAWDCEWSTLLGSDHCIITGLTDTEVLSHTATLLTTEISPLWFYTVLFMQVRAFPPFLYSLLYVPAAAAGDSPTRECAG